MRESDLEVINWFETFDWVFSFNFVYCFLEGGW